MLHSPSHHDYLACLPEPWRRRASAEPEATWWPWRDMEVHIARVRNQNAAARLLVLHGGGGHSEALWPAAALAADIGYEVLAPDLPGYGQTRVPDPAALRYPDWVDCVADLLIAEKAADRRPLIVFGASMGGMLAYSATARSGGVDHVIATCLLDPSDPCTWPALSRWGGAASLRLVRPMLRRLGPRLARLRLPLRWLVPMHRIANDAALARLCVSDPLGGGNRVALGFLASFVLSTPEPPPEAFRSPPITLAHPGDDRWTPAAMSLAFLERIAAPTRYVPLPEAGHFPVEPAGLHTLAALMQQLYDRARASADLAPAPVAEAATVGQLPLSPP